MIAEHHKMELCGLTKSVSTTCFSASKANLLTLDEEKQCFSDSEVDFHDSSKGEQQYYNNYC
jgi:hypothetical protein